uniref:Uncharacterized protein n=1 Tax=Podoviridae sp. ctt6T3 TaxID=2825282 RepID=A0A8S5PUC0_9CAUD|nr:MAG TPA: hypothetical protein [Podoviridae sp. ctt6T3]
MWGIAIGKMHKIHGAFLCNLHKSRLVTKSNNRSFLSTSITMYIV